MYDPKQPITELYTRCWKLLYKLGEKSKDHRLNETMYLKVGNFYVFSKNRHMILSVRDEQDHKRPVLEVDEDGKVNDAINIIECALALELFRKEMVLDDLADIGPNPDGLDKVRQQLG